MEEETVEMCFNKKHSLEHLFTRVTVSLLLPYELRNAHRHDVDNGSRPSTCRLCKKYPTPPCSYEPQPNLIHCYLHRSFCNFHSGDPS